MDHRVKIKENEKSDKNLVFAKEVKKQLNINVTVIPIVIGALGTVTKGLKKEIEMSGGNETFWTTKLLRSDRILRRVLETLQTSVNAHQR